MSAINSEVRLFSRLQELLILYLPPLVLVGLIFFKGPFDSRLLYDNRDFIFLLTVAYSIFFGLHSAYALSGWMDDAGLRQALRMPFLKPGYLSVFVIFCLGFVFFLMTKSGVLDHPWFRAGYGMIFFSLGVHHGYKQTLGISLLYNQEFIQRYGQREALQEVFRRSARFERIGYNLLFISVPFLSYQFFIKTFFAVESDFLYFVFVFLFAGSQIFLVASSVILWKASHQFCFKKLVFQTRNLFLAIPGGNIGLIIGPFVGLAFHSLETVFIYSNMRKNKELKSNRLHTLLFAVTVFFLLGYLRMHQKINMYVFETRDLQITAFAAALFNAFVIHHWMTERAMFNFKNPLIRALNGKSVFFRPGPESKT